MEEARDQGLSLAFFSGNEVYWRVRWDVGRMMLLGQVWSGLIGWDVGGMVLGAVGC